MVLDGSDQANENLSRMLYYDVTNGLARRAWARNENAVFAIQREMEMNPVMKVTLPNEVNGNLLDNVIS